MTSTRYNAQTVLPNFLTSAFPHALYSYSLVITEKAIFPLWSLKLSFKLFFVASLFQEVPKTTPWLTPEAQPSLPPTPNYQLPQVPSAAWWQRSYLLMQLSSSQTRTDLVGNSSVKQHILYLKREAFSSPKLYNDFPFRLQMKHTHSGADIFCFSACM